MTSSSTPRPLNRPPPRCAVRTFRPTRRAPEPTTLGWAIGVVLLLLVAGVGLAVARAEDDPEPTPVAERYQPASRGTRAAVLERAEVVDLAAEVFGGDVAQYVANIAWCESRHRPGARSAGFDRIFGWYEHKGLMQIAATIWTPLALELTGSDDLYDPWVNLVTARAIQRQQGWRAWPICSR